MAIVITPLEKALSHVGLSSDEEIEAVIDALGDDSLEVLLSISAKDLVDALERLHDKDKLEVSAVLINQFKGLLYWCYDMKRIGQDLEDKLDSYSNRAEFMADIKRSIDRQRCRKEAIEKQSDAAKAADPGPLTREQDFENWHDALYNVLSVTYGQDGVPLVYVIRDKDHQAGDTYSSFEEECVAKAELTGPVFEADSKSVHQIITPLVAGQSAAQWIKGIKSKKCGRSDLAKLREHFRGAGNQSRRIADAEQIQASLKYQSQRIVPFDKFLTQMVHMFNIFAEVGEPKSEAEKVRFLLDRAGKADSLRLTVETLKIAVKDDPVKWNFDRVSGHLGSQVELAHGSGSQNISALQGGGGDELPECTRQGNPPATGVMRDGVLFYGTYSTKSWKALEAEDKQLVALARKRFNKPSDNNDRHKKRKQKGGQKAIIKAIEKQSQVQREENKALQRQINKLDSRVRKKAADVSDSEESAEANAGDAFGGRAGKIRKKKKKNSN